MAADAPRFGNRFFPDASQLGIGSLVTINQSRVTFSGARGTVRVKWSVRIENAAAVAILICELNVIGTAPQQPVESSRFSLDAVVGEFVTVTEETVVTDPPDGSFVEVQTVISAGGTVDIVASSSILSFESRPPGVGAGPVVTVA